MYHSRIGTLTCERAGLQLGFCFLGRDVCSSFIVLHRYCSTLVLHGRFGDHPLRWGVSTMFHFFTLASLFLSSRLCLLLFLWMWIWPQLPCMNCISRSSGYHFTCSASYSLFGVKSFWSSMYRRRLFVIYWDVTSNLLLQVTLCPSTWLLIMFWRSELSRTERGQRGWRKTISLEKMIFLFGCNLYLGFRRWNWVLPDLKVSTSMFFKGALFMDQVVKFSCHETWWT